MASEAPHDHSDRSSPVHRDPNLRVIFGVTLVAVMGVSSISPAFPRIARALDVPAAQIGLLITAFTLPGIVFRPILGALADRWGRKVVLIPSLFLFGIAGGACALARDFEILLLLRFVQGLGVASLNSLAATVIGDLYSGLTRATAMGYNASVLSIGTASYPLLGGALAAFGWNYPFVLPLVAIPIGVLVITTLDAPEPETEEPMRDYLRGVWRSVADPDAIRLFGLTTATFVILFGVYVNYMPVLLGTAFGASSWLIGLLMSATSLSTAITSMQMGRISRRWSEPTLIRAAFALYALALATVPFTPSIGWLVIPALVFGVAQGINIPSLLTLLTGLAPMAQRGMFMSVNGMFLRLGQTVGPLAAGAIFAWGGTDGVFALGAMLAATLFAVILAVGVSSPAHQDAQGGSTG